MTPRRARRDDLTAILKLYGHLHQNDPVLNLADASVRDHWEKILADPA